MTSVFYAMLFAVLARGWGQDALRADQGVTAMSEILVARALLLDSRASQTRWSEWTAAEVAAFESRRARRSPWRPLVAVFTAATARLKTAR